MDRVQIKENAKSVLKRDHLLCAVVAFIVSILCGGTGMTTQGIPFNFSVDTSEIPSDFESMLNGFNMNTQMLENFFTGAFAITSVIVLFGFIIAIVFRAFVGNQLKVGSCRFYLKLRKNHPVDLGELIQSYRDKTFLNVAKATFMRDLFVALWSMLCFIPGLIKSYEYSAVDYLLCLNPTLEYRAALDLSKKIMNGHKMELFELRLSFLGWNILSLFTCGILGIVYVNPYYLISEAEFFSFVRENAIMNGVISSFDIPDYPEYAPVAPEFNGFNSPIGAPFTPTSEESVPVNDEPYYPVYGEQTVPEAETTDFTSSAEPEAVDFTPAEPEEATPIEKNELPKAPEEEN